MTKREQIIEIVETNLSSKIENDYVKKGVAKNIADAILAIPIDVPTEEEIYRECPAYCDWSGESLAWMAGVKWTISEIIKRNK